MRAALAALLVSPALSVAAGEIRLDLPLDCELGKTCYIQRYMDHDPGPQVRDYRCGGLSGDGHKGTDFALHTYADMRQGVPVRAAAPGKVVGLRDGMPDRLYEPANASGIEGRECGNGVVLQHEDGWETQYCHLRSGSVTAQEGDRLERGDVLGLVGLSGLTNYPHLHLSVRRYGAEVDPFRPDASADCAMPQDTLWQTMPPYVPGGLIYAGFADHMPDLQAVAEGTAVTHNITADSEALVLFTFAYAGQEGDIIRLEIDGPGEEILATDMTLKKAQVRYFRAAGKRLTRAAWPSGTYRGTATLLRGNAELARRVVQLTVP